MTGAVKVEASAVDRLVDRITAIGSPVCVGFDPVVERLPESLRPGAGADAAACAAAIERFCMGVLEAIDGLVPAVKPQSACFERYGSAGVAVLERLCGAARGRFEVILDVKRGDIGVTAEHYAAAALRMGAHWVTASAYLGIESMEPHLAAGLGVFAIVRTSNPGGDQLQGQALRDGRSIADAVAEMVARAGETRVGRCGLSSLGAVVGATKPEDARRLRERMPRQFFLVPGFGAQGAGVNDALACFRADRTGAIVSASRSVLYAFAPAERDWTASIRRAAEAFHREIAEALRR